MGTVLAKAIEPGRGCACTSNVQQKRATPIKLQSDLIVAVIGAASLSHCKNRVVRLVNRTENDYARQVKVET